LWAATGCPGGRKRLTGAARQRAPPPQGPGNPAGAVRGRAADLERIEIRTFWQQRLVVAALPRNAANVELNHLSIVHQIGVANDHREHAAAVPYSERQPFAANVAIPPYRLEERCALRPVPEETQVPERPAQQLLPRVPQDLGDEGVGVLDDGSLVVEDQDALSGRHRAPSR